MQVLCEPCSEQAHSPVPTPTTSADFLPVNGVGALVASVDVNGCDGGGSQTAAPVVANDGPDDVGQGRWLPTLAVDQLGATLGRWLGVSDSDLSLVLPNLANFSQRNLGFMA